MSRAAQSMAHFFQGGVRRLCEYRRLWPKAEVIDPDISAHLSSAIEWHEHVFSAAHGLPTIMRWEV
jgi:hypothetical protein